MTCVARRPLVLDEGAPAAGRGRDRPLAALRPEDKHLSERFIVVEGDSRGALDPIEHYRRLDPGHIVMAEQLLVEQAGEGVEVARQYPDQVIAVSRHRAALDNFGYLRDPFVKACNHPAGVR